MGWFIAWLWQGVVLVAVVEVALRCTKRASAATRYAVWWSTLALLSGFPWVEASLRAVLAAPAAAPMPPVHAAAPLLVELPSLPVELMIATVSAWALLAGARLACLAAGAHRLIALKRRCTPLPEAVEAGLVRWRRVRRQGRPTRIVTSSEITVASVLGLTRPAIAIPESLVDSLDANELDQVVLHEYAHVQRRDDWFRLLQLAVQAVLVFHPATWWIGRALDLEREVACDDWVLARGGRREYACCLATVARATCAPPIALAPEIAASPTVLARRLTRVLDHSRNRCSRFSSRVVVAGLCGALVLVVAIDRWSPRVALEPDIGRVPTIEGQPLRQLRALARAPLTPRTEGLDVTVDVPRVVRRTHAAPAPRTPIVPTGTVRDWQRAIAWTPAAPVRVENRPAQPPLEATAVEVIHDPRRVPATGLDQTLWSDGLVPAPQDDGIDAEIRDVTPSSDVWTVTAEAGMAIGSKTKKAGLATAGFFTKMGKSIARAF